MNIVSPVATCETHLLPHFSLPKNHVSAYGRVSEVRTSRTGTRYVGVRPTFTVTVATASRWSRWSRWYRCSVTPWGPLAEARGASRTSRGPGGASALCVTEGSFARGGAFAIRRRLHHAGGDQPESALAEKQAAQSVLPRVLAPTSTRRPCSVRVRGLCAWVCELGCGLPRSWLELYDKMDARQVGPTPFFAAFPARDGICCVPRVCGVCGPFEPGGAREPAGAGSEPLPLSETMVGPAGPRDGPEFHTG